MLRCWELGVSVWPLAISEGAGSTGNHPCPVASNGVPHPAPRPWLPPGSRVGRGMAAKSFEMMVTLAEEAASE